MMGGLYPASAQVRLGEGAGERLRHGPEAPGRFGRTARNGWSWRSPWFGAGQRQETSRLLGDLAVVVRSGLNGWQGIMEPRLALIGTTGMGVAVQLVVLSFVHTVVVSQGRGRDRATRAD